MVIAGLAPSLFLKRILRVRGIKAVISVALFAGALGYLITSYDLASVNLRAITWPTLAMVALALLANALMATIRFKAIAAEMGHRVPFGQAMHAVSASTLAGALCFQLAGQIISRRAILHRIPFANIVAITLFERVTAAVISGLLAIAGAYFVFGRVYVDASAGGDVLIKLAAGLIAATFLGAVFGYARTVTANAAPTLSVHLVRSAVKLFGFALLVQFPMMLAYVMLAHALSPGTPVFDLVAASAVVMFAASVPISLAGWGVREMSAVAALGMIGVAPSAAFATAVMIGTGSLLAMGAMAAISIGAKDAGETSSDHVAPLNYETLLAYAFPIIAATLVLFQVHVPIGKNLLNVNLADPVVLLGAALFITQIMRRPQIWSVNFINKFVVFATWSMTLSLLIGVSYFGLTDWAWMNRYLGWFMLLSYAACGALITRADPDNGLRILTMTFAGATIAVCGIEILGIVLSQAGFKFSPTSYIFPIQGFAQNRNALAFQAFMALAGLIVFANKDQMRPVLIAAVVVTIWFTGSRTGWIACGAIIAASLYLRALSLEHLARSALYAVALVIVIKLIPIILHIEPGMATRFEFLPDTASTNERMLSLTEGVRMFLEYPIFGAGLGAFRNLGIPSSAGGQPLVIHSTGLWLLAETGIFGFLAFVVPFTLTWFGQFQLARADKGAALIVLCLTGFAVMSLTADMLYHRTVWILLGAALATLPAEKLLRPVP